MSNAFNPIHVQKLLSGVDYPANRKDLVAHARAHNADKNTLTQLERIPDRRYEGPTAVSRALAGHS